MFNLCRDLFNPCLIKAIYATGIRVSQPYDVKDNGTVIIGIQPCPGMDIHTGTGLYAAAILSKRHLIETAGAEVSFSSCWRSFGSEGRLA